MPEERSQGDPVKLNGREESPQGGQRPFIHSHIQQIFINIFNTCYVKGTIVAGFEHTSERDNKLNKLYAYWISDMKIIKWGDIVEQLGLGVRAREGPHPEK